MTSKKKKKKKILLLRTCRKTSLLSNEFRWIRRRTINRSLSRCSFTRVLYSSFFFSLSLFFSIINPRFQISFFFLPSLSDYGRRVARFEDNAETTEKKEARQRGTWKGASIGSIPMEPSWCRLRNYAGITRPVRRTNSTKDPGDFAEQRVTPLSHLPRRRDRPTSISSTPRGRTITW